MKMNAYLMFDGRCEAAFRFYAQVFGGKLELLTYGRSPMAERTPPEQRDKVMHVSLNMGEGVLMGSDAPPQFYQPMQGFHVTLVLADPAEAERIFDALSDGGEVRMALQETFWAAKFGMVVDRFGTPWMVSCERAT